MARSIHICRAELEPWGVDMDTSIPVPFIILHFPKSVKSEDPRFFGRRGPYRGVSGPSIPSRGADSKIEAAMANLNAISGQTKPPERVRGPKFIITKNNKPSKLRLHDHAPQTG